MPRTTTIQRGAAGICLVSLGTFGFLAGSAFSQVEVTSRANDTMDSLPKQIAGQSETGSTAMKTESKIANFESGAAGEIDPLALGANTFCGPDGDFESCSLGPIGGGGSGIAPACPDAPNNPLWATSTAAPAVVASPFVSNLNPNGGTQHMRFEWDPNQPDTDASRNWAFSEDLPAIGVDPTWARPLGTITKLSLDLYISTSTTGGQQNTFIVQPQAGAEGLLTTLLQFNTAGNIVVGDTDATAPEGSFFIVTTDATFERDVYRTIEIYVDNSFNSADPDFPGRIVYVYDGLTVWSTGAGQGGLGGGVFAGTQIQEVLLRWDTNLNDGVFVDVDNVCIETGATVPDLNGACCVEDMMNPGTVLCTVETAASCAAISGATYAGDTVGCDVGCPDRIECLNGDGDCFTPNATPGCDDTACCDAVCFASPFCCDVEWDADCVAAAETTCPPPTSCPIKADATGATGTCQDFSEVNASTSLAGAFTVADDFVADADGSITQICFWGAYLPAEDTDDFTVRYYDCVDGLPTNVIAEIPTGGLGGLQLISRQDTGFQVADTAPIFEYVYNHIGVAVTAGEKYFVEVVNNTPDLDMDGVGDTTWFWEFADAATSPNANGSSFQTADDGSGYARFEGATTDYAFCVNIVTAIQDGVCDLPAPTPCELDLSGATDAEGEACQLDPDLNDGCSNDTAPFNFSDFTASTDPAAPSLISGISWADGGTRDIDWYRTTALASVDANADLEVTVCVAIASELPMAAVLIQDDPADGECGDVFTAALDAVGFDCAASLAVGYTLSVDDGIGNPVDTEFFVLARSADGAELFEGAPCGGDGMTTLGNNYLLEVAVTDTFEMCFPEAPDCPEDLDGDLEVGFNDLVLLLGAWCTTPDCALGSPEDLDGDGQVGFNDLVLLLGAWGPC